MRRELARLEADIGLCDRCFGYEARWVTRFQRPAGTARILLVGERAPRSLLESQRRLGLESEDDASRNLRELVEHAELPPEECVVAASILCRPRSRALESAVPDRACRRACAVHVRSIVLALRPRLIVPMGRSALESLRHAFPTLDPVRSLRFPASVGHTTKAGDTFIHPVFLPTRRARVHRSAEVQREDWRGIGTLWRQIAEDDGGPGLGPD
jgi:uracil-DNA glycosylase